jgi:malonate transporter
MVAAVAALLFTIACGAACSALRVFPSPDAALTALNRYALYVAFPAWMVASLAVLDDLRSLGPWIAAQAVAIVLWWLVAIPVARRVAAPADTPALFASSLYGNTAYLGIAWCAAVWGERGVAMGAVAAAVHIGIGMLALPVAFARAASGAAHIADAVRAVLRLPLTWSPVVGALCTLLPDLVRDPIVAVLSPVGRSAGPVALFLLGLYLYTHRAAVFVRAPTAAAAVAAKMTLFPALVGAAVYLVPGAAAAPNAVAVAFVQASMPVGITVFALAEEYGAGQALSARAIVLSTLVWLGIAVPFTLINAAAS